MLIAQRDFQVKHLLAVALKAEMARLDDAGVDRADRDLVNFLPLDAVKVHHADDGTLVRITAPGVVTGPIRRVEPHRLEPRMPVGPHAELLGNLALEKVNLRDIPASATGNYPSPAVCVTNVEQRPAAVGNDGIQFHAVRSRMTEQGRRRADPPSTASNTV